ncbi:hypothetical protein Atoyac1_24 [Aeromonas phage Atoyac1]|uniref:Uncharacterized protein n=1 Tax=Aeromonas phage Atoyac1 TaxID=2767547 RepID=A0A866D1T6_9CAUD|nr:hypothetical protein Atoyac1_24 [Aeromonas phage Atoyac1]
MPTLGLISMSYDVVKEINMCARSAKSSVPERHTFKRGPGPCGKTVDSLKIAARQHGVSVLQHTECGEMKEFYYPYPELVGRITITHKESPQ